MSENNAPRNSRKPQQNSRRPQKRRPEPKPPRAVIIIYIIMAILILGICGIVFVVTLKGTEDKNASQNSNSSVTSTSDSSPSGNSESSPAESSSDISESSPASSAPIEPTSSDSSSVNEPTQSSSSTPEVNPPESMDGLTILGANMVYVGEGYSFSYEAPGFSSETLDVKWECVGDSGKITENGWFTAIKKGEVTLIAKDTANNIGGKFLVHVVNSASEVDFVPMVNNIAIVNKTYALPSDYAPGGLTAETNAAFKKLVNGAAADGINIYLISGYRSYAKQQSTYLGWCNTYGQKEADRISARPGFSEHQLGMAIDVNSLEESFENTPEGQWLAEHCWEYGFIIRYPKGKEHLTGYSYEPWHIRYLGKELAKKVYDSGLCLEEYLGIDSSYR